MRGADGPVIKCLESSSSCQGLLSVSAPKNPLACSPCLSNDKVPTKRCRLEQAKHDQSPEG